MSVYERRFCVQGSWSSYYTDDAGEALAVYWQRMQEYYDEAIDGAGVPHVTEGECDYRDLADGRTMITRRGDVLVSVAALEYIVQRRVVQKMIRELRSSL